MNKVYVIGIGNDGAKSLTSHALDLIHQAELLIGGERHLELFEGISKERLVIKSNLEEVTDRIAQEFEHKRIVVLASGDPLFYGIGKYIINKLGKENVEILPNVSSMQLAFARVKESWDDAVILSLHARNIDDTFETIRHASKVGIFTDDENTPARIATLLLKKGISGFRAFICENLGAEDERVIEADLSDLLGIQCGPLNVLILIKKIEKGDRHLFLQPGIPDDQLQPDEGLITKAEVRVISISKMALTSRSIVWDIGAGSGAVSIESALIAKDGQVYAIEKDERCISLILKNIEKFNTRNVNVIHGIAPGCLVSIKDRPDAVFIGGSAGRMSEILKFCVDRADPQARIVINVTTIENLHEAMEGFKRLGMNPQAVLVQVSRSKPIHDLTRFEALNPVYIIWAGKK